MPDLLHLKKQIIMPVKSPYNFVPAPSKKEVKTADWAEQVSHDIPFSDGESGEMKFTLTAKTPIFIRNGHGPEEETAEFSHVKGSDGKPRYFIPATSVKGMIRNVLEIMSRSRMRMVNDTRYSFRDLSSESLYLKTYDRSKVLCGWLKKDHADNWTIVNCGSPVLIEHETIDNLIEERFGKNPEFKILFDHAVQDQLDSKYKSGINKYRKLKQITKSFFTEITYGDITGKLIFTGQPGLRNYQTEQGKFNEFIFQNKNGEELNVSEDQQKDFKFIYLDHDENNISTEWKFWRTKLNAGEEIPVFFNKDNNDKLQYFGLAYMFKLPFKQSIKETLPYRNYHFEKMDLAETIFGSEKYQNPLKGRVFFSNSFSDNAKRAIEMKREILASPKASYYPFYLKQPEIIREYSTYMNSNSVLKGFKRYPIQNGANRGNYTKKQESNGKVFCKFFPLESGAEFEGAIRFHNLRPIEIGALISAITFHRKKDTFHRIGAAKPFGYGQVKMNLELNEKSLKLSEDEYLAIFETFMGGEEWINAPMMKELILMASQDDPSLEYPNNVQSFVRYKNANPKEQLLPYSKIVDDKNYRPPSSFTKKMEAINKGFDFEVKKLSELKKEISDRGFKKIPEPLWPSLKSIVIDICKDHRDSKKKLLNKPFDNNYEWKNTFTNWLGEVEARKFNEELIQKFTSNKK